TEFPSCRTLPREARLSPSLFSFCQEFSSGYLIGELLNKYELQDDFDQFSQSRLSNAKLNNFSRMEPTLQLLGVQFDQNIARNIMTEQRGAATKLIYQLYVALEKKKKAGLTGVAMDAMRPSAHAKLKNVGTEIYREKIVEKRRQNEIMAKIQAAIIHIPKPMPQHTVKAIEDQKLLKKRREAEVEIQEFENMIQVAIQAKTPTVTELLNTYSDDEYIRKIQKRLEEDTFAREQREKRRRKMLREQLIAHEAHEEAYREEQLINQLMRQSQQERRIAVQLMHVRHEKEVLWQNRIYREKQFEERRLKEFQEALDREAALAEQEKIELEEQALKEKQMHERLAAERATARYKKHYAICWEVVEQIIDLVTKIGEYRTLTNNLIPVKLMRDWKELFLKGKPIYEQAEIDPLPTEPTPEQLIELDKMNLLDEKDYDEYKSMTEEWYPPEEIRANKPPPDNPILGHVIHRLMEIIYPPEPEPPPPVFSPFPIKGCILGKLYSGKTTSLKFLEKACNIQVLSVDTLIAEAIKAFHENEMGSETSLDTAKVEERALDQIHVTFRSLFNFLLQIPQLSIRAQLGAAAEILLKKGKSIPDELLIGIMVEGISQLPPEKGWIMDGFPMTLNQAKLLEKALTGKDPDQTETKAKILKKLVLVANPTVPKEPSLHPPGLDFAILLEVSDFTVLNRVASERCKLTERVHSVRGQMQHRIVGFLDTWPELETWFSEQQKILIKVNAEMEKDLLCQRMKEILMEEIIKAQNKSTPRAKEKGKSGTPSPEIIVAPAPVEPPPVKPGSSEWVYVDEPLPQEVPEFLVPYWETVEKTYVNNIKATLRCLRAEQHVIIHYLSHIRNHFKEYLKRPDHKQEFVAQWQADYNAVADDLWDDDETKEEMHQRVTDLRDRLWDICENRRDEAEQERCDIMSDGWLPDRMGLMMNHIFSLMQNEMDRFQDTKRLLHDYYRGMEGKIPTETSTEFTRIPLIELAAASLPPSLPPSRIPMIAHRSPSPEVNREKIKAIPVNVKDDLFSESIIFNFGPDEKLIVESWHNIVTAISNMLQVYTKYPLFPTGSSSPSVIEATPIPLSPEELKKQELKFRMKQEYFAALEHEAEAAKSRLELLKVKALAFVEDLQSKAELTFRKMETWLGERFLAEMSSVDKLTEVARNHIETSTRIQYELVLEGIDFYINGDIKVFPDPLLPPRPPSVEMATDSTLTISQLSTLHKQFLQVAPKGLIPSKTFIDLLYDLITLNLGSNLLPDSWMHLSIYDLQNLASLLMVNTDIVDWRRFLLAASQPWPMPSVMELLETLQRFQDADRNGSGFVTQEEYEQVGLWFKGSEDLVIPESPTEPLPFNRQEHLIRFLFTLFADPEKDPPQLNYTEMLLYFASHPDSVDGVYRALSVATRTYIHRMKEKHPPVPQLISSDGHDEQEEEETAEEGEEEEEEKDKEKEEKEREEDTQSFTNEGDISLATLLRVFQHESNKAADNHRFSGYLTPFIKVYKDLGSEELEPIKIALLLKHPFIQDLISSYQEYRLHVSIFSLGSTRQSSGADRAPW
uniref:Sperm flagellar 2 n=1 Tax=Varanus komodoensis TaxID=61221 RepID=A0A8D2J7S0_VARKO